MDLIDMSAMLYVVATPIGNLADISRRATEVLGSVALIAAEDTRRTRVLLAEIGVRPRELIALHDHNEAEATARVLAVLKRGDAVALVSDAGTPLLSDPGFALVRACWQEGIALVPVPGPSALTAALSVCPLALEDIQFAGFLPARAEQRRRRLKELIGRGNPVMFFEAPHRLQHMLADLDQLAGTRRLFVAREMTKRFESLYCDRPAELARRLAELDQVRGEFVCVLEGGSQRADDAEARRVMGVLCAELPPAQAARLGAHLLDRRKGELYDLALALRDQG